MKPKEFDPKALSDDHYWKYVHGEKPKDLFAWLLSQDLSEEEAGLLVEEVDMVKKEKEEAMEKSKNLTYVTDQNGVGKKEFDGGLW